MLLHKRSSFAWQTFIAQRVSCFVPDNDLGSCAILAAKPSWLNDRKNIVTTGLHRLLCQFALRQKGITRHDFPLSIHASQHQQRRADLILVIGFRDASRSSFNDNNAANRLPTLKTKPPDFKLRSKASDVDSP